MADGIEETAADMHLRFFRSLPWIVCLAMGCATSASTDPGFIPRDGGADTSSGDANDDDADGSLPDAAKPDGATPETAPQDGASDGAPDGAGDADAGSDGASDDTGTDSGADTEPTDTGSDTAPTCGPSGEYGPKCKNDLDCVSLTGCGYKCCAFDPIIGTISLGCGRIAIGTTCLP